MRWWPTVTGIEVQAADQPIGLAGHSLGEIAALVAAGALELDDAVRLVHIRGGVMEEALRGAAKGVMAALIGTDVHEFAVDLCAEAGVWIANDNSPVQIMISGREPGMAEATRRASEAGFVSS